MVYDVVALAPHDLASARNLQLLRDLAGLLQIEALQCGKLTGGRTTLEQKLETVLRTLADDQSALPAQVSECDVHTCYQDKLQPAATTARATQTGTSRYKPTVRWIVYCQKKAGVKCGVG